MNKYAGVCVKRIEMIRALKGRSTGMLLFPIDEQAAGMFKTSDDGMYSMCVQERGTLTGRAGDQEFWLSLFVYIFKGFSFITGGFVTIAVFIVERSVPV